MVAVAGVVVVVVVVVVAGAAVVVVAVVVVVVVVAGATIVVLVVVMELGPIPIHLPALAGLQPPVVAVGLGTPLRGRDDEGVRIHV